MLLYDTESAQFLFEEEPSNDTMTKSIVGVIGSVDAYQLPDAKGLTALTRHVPHGACWAARVSSSH